PLKDTFETACWNNAEDIRRSFEQTQGGKKKKLQFTDEVLSGKYTAVEHKKEDIQKLYDIAYDPNAQKYPLFKTSADLVGKYDLSGASYLGEEVTSRSETQFAKFMRALNATEWVRQGHADYIGHSKGKCPFCQGDLPANFEKDIAEAFDEGYQKALDALEVFETAYAEKMQALITLLKDNLNDVFPKVKTAEYEKLIAQLKTLVTENEQLIAQKRATPGQIISLKDTDVIVTDIDGLIVDINKQIQENNDIVATKHDKQLECFNMVWEEIAFLLKDNVAAYLKSKADIESETKPLDKKVKKLREKYKALTSEINTLNAKVINTAATVDSINAHLKDSGFEGFWLREKAGTKGTYEVIREDGKVADKLSEGERNFIAFLYFYHLVRGSQSETDSGKDKIVVIDDPVSSMDSSALFIVSALVREMIGVCSNNIRLEGHEYKGKYIQQLFILTHNAFFHREITYNQVSHYRYVNFFKVNKKNNISTVEKCVIEATKISEKDRNYNPVQNSYAALWREYEKLDVPIPLMNVIRRILEYYFLQLCGYDSKTLSTTVLSAVKKQITKEAEGSVPDYTKYHLAQAMLSYIQRADSFNDGLHFVDESISCEQYREVFRIIFDVMGQSQHYKMMMNETE
ncbi:MAG: AAA family ATPase, partial [Bacteroidales bacterium]|nr:AAA family ATPase [Bacteroidales bacterium]